MHTMRNSGAQALAHKELCLSGVVRRHNHLIAEQPNELAHHVHKGARVNNVVVLKGIVHQESAPSRPAEACARAETVDRVCLGLELDPLFVDVGVRRWQAFTGKEVTLQGGGSFEVIASERLSSPGPSSPPSARRAHRATKATDCPSAPSAEAPG
jgi:hypothetical protein